MSKNIGVPGVSAPEEVCTDKYCPFHGTTRIRGKITKGVVVSRNSTNTAIIRRDYDQFVKKYQRYERRNSRLACHVPKCLDEKIQIDDYVLVGESRKISKMKSFIVLDKIKSEGA